MSRFLIVYRLATRDLQHHLIEAALLLILIGAAMATLTLSLALPKTTTRPYDATKAATTGPDVVASSVGFSNSGQASPNGLGDLEALINAPGVTEHSGPYPVAWPTLQFNGISAQVMAEGRDVTPALVDQPDVLQGHWLADGGVVVERGFADSIGVHVGDQVLLGGRAFRVVGIAVTAAVPVYTQLCFYGGCSGPVGRPRSLDTGLVWVMKQEALQLAAHDNPVTYYLNLRLKDANAAPAFVDAHQPPHGRGPSPLTAWQSLRDASATLFAQETEVLSPASWLLGLLAVASMAVVAGGRMAEQRRRVGLIKAAGGTPFIVAAVLLAQHIAVACIAGALGLLAGWAVGPLLANPGGSLLSGPRSVAFTPATIGLILGTAIGIAAIGTFIPALRAARTSTVAALAGTTATPRRHALLIRFSTWWPVPMLLGLRLIAHRPYRALLGLASFMIAATTAVADLILHATLSLDFRSAGAFLGPPDPGQARVSDVLLVVTIALILLASANAIFTTWTTVVEERRFAAIVRSLGATPMQTTAALAVTQIMPALVGALLGIPAGIALYGAVQNGGPVGHPGVASLLAVVLGMLISVAVLTAIPARVGIRKSIAEVLKSETR